MSENRCIFANSGLKTGMNFRGQVWKLACLGLKLGRDLKTRAAHPHQEFRGVPPRECQLPILFIFKLS